MYIFLDGSWNEEKFQENHESSCFVEKKTIAMEKSSSSKIVFTFKKIIKVIFLKVVILRFVFEPLS